MPHHARQPNTEFDVWHPAGGQMTRDKGRVIKAPTAELGAKYWARAEDHPNTLNSANAGPSSYRVCVSPSEMPDFVFTYEIKVYTARKYNAQRINTTHVPHAPRTPAL